MVFNVFKKTGVISSRDNKYYVIIIVFLNVEGEGFYCQVDVLLSFIPVQRRQDLSRRLQIHVQKLVHRLLEIRGLHKVILIDGRVEDIRCFVAATPLDYREILLIYTLCVL